MTEELINFCYLVMKWLVGSIGIGWGMNIALFGILDAFELLDPKNLKLRKKLCWIYFTGFVFQLFVLLYIAR